MADVQPTRVLIVDDEKSMRDLLAIALEPDGHRVSTVPSVVDARRAMAKEPFDLVVSDIAMPGESGIDLLEEIRGDDPELPVILITAYASMEAAKRAFSLGVFDCIDKGASFSVEEFRATVRNAIDSRQTREENRRLRKQLISRHGPGSLVANSDAMRSVAELIERVAPTTSTVLISGESGTGKEVVARTIHYSSPRAKSAFVSINCGALPQSLLESELFGHVKGAFTGAVAAKKGLFEVASDGTVFLDEIGEMPAEAQVRLLRVLQEKTVRPVGGTREIPANARVLAATNADLPAKVAEKAFREDLFYRINVIAVALPPLRERRADIAELAETFVRRYAGESGKSVSGFSPECLRALEAYSWPGNVRELENSVQRALALTTGPRIEREALPPEVTATPGPGAARVPPIGGEAAGLPAGHRLDEYLESVKASIMQQALEESGYVQVEAARRLGMTFRSFRYFAKQFKLDVRRPEPGARNRGTGR
ncbi:MAG: sigma-54-dependent transcriptional regulator [Acidobacteriota bacterium]